MSNQVETRTFSDNIAILSEGIVKAIELAKPHEWHEWDSFAGRTVYRKQPLRDAQRQSVEKFLKAVFEKERVDYEQTSGTTIDDA